VRKDSDGYSKGYGSVTFNTVEEAEAAYDAMDGQKIDDKEVRVLLTKWTA
jgi:RNA recognition motif-containing protein